MEDDNHWVHHDAEFIKWAVRQNGNVLSNISDEFKNNKEIVMLAVTQTSAALEYASNELRNDPEVIAACSTTSCSS